MNKRVSPACCSPESCCETLNGLLAPGFFKALGEGNRIALLARLAGLCRPCTVTEIACCCPVGVSVVSRHLAILRDAGIVQSQRRGKQVYYTVRYDVLARTFREIADAIDACCTSPFRPPVKTPRDAAAGERRARRSVSADGAHNVGLRPDTVHKENEHEGR